MAHRVSRSHGLRQFAQSFVVDKASVVLDIQSIAGEFAVEQGVQYALANQNDGKVEHFAKGKSKVVHQGWNGISSSPEHYLEEPLSSFAAILVHVGVQLLHQTPLQDVLPEDPWHLDHDGNDCKDKGKPDIVSCCSIFTAIIIILRDTGSGRRDFFLERLCNMSAAVEKAKGVDVGVATVADHGVLVEVVVAGGEDEADDDDHKGPLMVESEDEVVDPDLAGVEQLLHLVAEGVGNTKQSRHFPLKDSVSIHPENTALLYKLHIPDGIKRQAMIAVKSKTEGETCSLSA